MIVRNNANPTGINVGPSHFRGLSVGHRRGRGSYSGQFILPMARIPVNEYKSPRRYYSDDRKIRVDRASL